MVPEAMIDEYHSFVESIVDKIEDAATRGTPSVNVTAPNEHCALAVKNVLLRFGYCLKWHKSDPTNFEIIWDWE